MPLFRIQISTLLTVSTALLLLGLATMAGCAGGHSIASAPHDRPFPLGQVTDAHWETQQTNAEAADFIFYDHEFVGDTTQLGPAGRRHLEEVALRLPHVPFPVVVAANDQQHELSIERRNIIASHLAAMGVEQLDGRVVAAPAFAEGFTAIEAENAYRRGVLNSANGSGGGRPGRGGTMGATYR